MILGVKNPPATAGDIRVWSLDWEDPVEGMVTHSSIVEWRIPWTEEPGSLQSIGSQRVGHDCGNLEHMSILISFFSTCKSGKDSPTDCTWHWKKEIDNSLIHHTHSLGRKRLQATHVHIRTALRDRVNKLWEVPSAVGGCGWLVGIISQTFRKLKAASKE